MSRGRLAYWFGWFVALNVVWLALISAFDLAETVAGLAASAVAAGAATAIHETGLVRFRPRGAWLAGWWRIPWRTVVETGVVFGALWRRVARGEPIAGRFRAEPVRLVDDPTRVAARRALRTLGASIAPNSYVVGIDEEDETVLLHELVPARGPPR